MVPSLSDNHCHPTSVKEGKQCEVRVFVRYTPLFNNSKLPLLPSFSPITNTGLQGGTLMSSMPIGGAHQSDLNTPCVSKHQADMACQCSAATPVLITTSQSQPTSSGGARVVAAGLAVPATSSCVSDRLEFATAMFGVFSAITCYAEPNFCGAHLLISTNLHLHEWVLLFTTEEVDLTLAFLTYSFSVGYEGPVPTPTFNNHPSVVRHSRDVAAYITKELGEGAILGPFDTPPPFFSP